MRPGKLFKKVIFHGIFMMLMDFNGDSSWDLKYLKMV